MMTYEEAHALFRYDPDTGIITNKVSRIGTSNIGKEAGNARADGYRHVKLDGSRYLSHRVAWLMRYGVWPIGDVDHINGVRLDNRIANLRDVDKGENARNAKQRSDNKSNVTGVYWCNTWGKWKAQINHNKKSYLLGTFDDWFEAVCARKSAEVRFGFHVNHGRTG